jgi:hypothetical protein
MKFRPCLAAALGFSLLAGLSPARAQSDAKPQPFPATSIEEVLVPVPSEVFTVLDKLGEPDWKGQLPPEGKLPVISNRTDSALLLGVVVADGFIAVEAGDATAVQNLGRQVLQLADTLALKDAVQAHTDAILTASQRNEWDRVRAELDKVQNTVRGVMTERRDQNLALAVSLAGWLRGTEAATGVILKAYSTDRADILRQPEIVDGFVRQMEALRGSSPKISNLARGLHELQKMLYPDTETPGEDTVEEMNSITTRLVKEIRTAKS